MVGLLVGQWTHHMPVPATSPPALPTALTTYSFSFVQWPLNGCRTEEETQSIFALKQHDRKWVIFKMFCLFLSLSIFVIADRTVCSSNIPAPKGSLLPCRVSAAISHKACPLPAVLLTALELLQSLHPLGVNLSCSCHISLAFELQEVICLVSQCNCVFTHQCWVPCCFLQRLIHVRIALSLI